jgi:hypothetical protein
MIDAMMEIRVLYKWEEDKTHKVSAKGVSKSWGA